MSFCIFLIIIGAIILAFALADFQRSIVFIKRGQWVEGAVIELIETQGEDDIYYHPLFEITTGENEKITYEGVNGSAPPAWKIGQKAPFIYVAGESPALKRLRYWSVFGRPLLLLAIAVDLIVVGAGYFLLMGYFGG